jgi:ketosteroid isomerase-like protein
MHRSRISKLFSAVAITLFAATLLAPGRVANGDSGRQHTEDERELISLDRRWGEAVVRGDAAELDALLADDYSLTGPSGEVLNKSEELAEVKAQAFLTYKGYRAEDVTVTVSGGRATVSGRAALTFLLDGQEVSRSYRYERTFARSGAGWRIISARMITVTLGED